MSAHKMTIFRIQHIDRKNYKEIIENSHMIDEFERLCESFTFVYSRDYPETTPETFRIHARNVPSKESPRNLIYSIKILRYNININQSKSIYLLFDQ